MSALCTHTLMEFGALGSNQLTRATAFPGQENTNLYTGRPFPSHIFSCTSRGHTWKHSSGFLVLSTLRVTLNGRSSWKQKQRRKKKKKKKKIDLC